VNFKYKLPLVNAMGGKYEYYHFTSLDKTVTQLYSDTEFCGRILPYLPEEPSVGREPPLYMVRQTAEVPAEPAPLRLWHRVTNKIRHRIYPPHTPTVAPIPVDLIVELKCPSLASKLREELYEAGYEASHRSVALGVCDFRIVQHGEADELEQAVRGLLQHQIPRDYVTITGRTSKELAIVEEHGNYTVNGKLRGLVPAVILTAKDLIRNTQHAHINVGYSWDFFGDEALNNGHARR
jgi:hypothetical protein